MRTYIRICWVCLLRMSTIFMSHIYLHIYILEFGSISRNIFHSLLWKNGKTYVEICWTQNLYTCSAEFPVFRLVYLGASSFALLVVLRFRFLFLNLIPRLIKLTMTTIKKTAGLYFRPFFIINCLRPGDIASCIPFNLSLAKNDDVSADRTIFFKSTQLLVYSILYRWINYQF